MRLPQQQTRRTRGPTANTVQCQRHPLPTPPIRTAYGGEGLELVGSSRHNDALFVVAYYREKLEIDRVAIVVEG
nr:hypothetical protein Iba_scaffold45626CG0020 [Ipomoea batatas]